MIDLPSPNPGIEIVYASRGMSKGLAQTDGAQVVPKAFVQFGTVQIGGQWKNVTSSAAEGEAAAFAAFAPKIGGFQLSLGAAYKFQTAVHGKTDDDALEFSGSISRRFGKVGLRLGLVYSPDDFGSTRRSLFVDFGQSIDFDKSTRLSGTIGWRERVGSPDYTAFNAGVTRTLVRALSVDLRYFGTAQRRLGDAYKDRAVVSARFTF